MGKGSRSKLKQASVMRCGKWVLRCTKVRRERGIMPTTPIPKRKRPPQSPTSSANSVVGENNIKVPRMDKGKKIDMDNWSSFNTGIFIQIMVEEAKKEQQTNSRMGRVFNELQWKEIHRELFVRTGKAGYTLLKIQQKFDRLKKEYKIFKELIDHTGLGWDPVSKTVTTPEHVWQDYIKAHPGAAKYRQRGLDHYDMLHELLESSLATGAFLQPSVLGAATSDEELAMYDKGKPIKMEDSASMGSGKRKSGSAGGSSAKKERLDKKQEAYEMSAYANQMRGEFYVQMTSKQVSQQQYSISNCIALLKEIKQYIDKTQYLKAYNLLVSDEGQREGFVNLEPDTRVDWANYFDE